MLAIYCSRIRSFIFFLVKLTKIHFLIVQFAFVIVISFARFKGSNEWLPCYFIYSMYYPNLRNVVLFYMIVCMFVFDHTVIYFMRMYCTVVEVFEKQICHVDSMCYLLCQICIPF